MQLFPSIMDCEAIVTKSPLCADYIRSIWNVYVRALNDMGRNHAHKQQHPVDSGSIQRSRRPMKQTRDRGTTQLANGYIMADVIYNIVQKR